MRESRFTHLTRLKRPLLIGAAVWVATQHPAHAADEIQVYNAGIAAVGQFTIEQHLNYTPLGVKEPPFPGGLVSNGAINGTPEFAYGLTDWWEVGLYLPFAIQNQTFYSNAFKVRTLFVSPHADQRDFFYGINFEFANETPPFAQTHPPRGWRASLATISTRASNIIRIGAASETSRRLPNRNTRSLR